MFYLHPCPLYGILSSAYRPLDNVKELSCHLFVRSDGVGVQRGHVPLEGGLLVVDKCDKCRSKLLDGLRRGG